MNQVFKDETVYIVGGGSSLRTFDWKKLDGKAVIAVNRAYLQCKPRMVVFWDPEIYEEYFHEMPQVPLVTIRQFAWQLPNVHQWPPEVNGNVNNSGHFAIAIAFLYGAKEVYLLGFDMRGSERWYEYSGRFLSANLDSKVQTFERYKGMPIYNCNPDSAIRIFEFREI